MCFGPHSVNTLQHIGCYNYCVHIIHCKSYIDDLTTASYVGDDSMA